jgi:hypothetical protein
MHWGFTLLIIAVIWFIVYIVGRFTKIDEKFDWTFGPLFLLMRTRRFNNIIKRIAKKYARFWRIFGNVSIFFGLLMTIASIGVLIFSLVNFFKPVIPIDGSPTVGILIPGVTISFRTFLYLIIPIILTMIPHELAHGVVSHADGVELRSTGLAFFAIFFGAFVEPEEEDLLKSSYNTRMRTFASGMFPNLILGLLTIPVLIFSANILSPFYHAQDGVLIHEVTKDSAADTGGLKRGIAIFDINNTHIYNYDNFSSYMNYTRPNDLLVLNTTEGTINIVLGHHPDNNQTGYLGVGTHNYRAPKFPWAWKFFPRFFEQELLWTIVVTFGSVLFNALPIPFILDGDKLLSSFLFQYVKNKNLALIILDVFRFLALVLFLAVLIIPLFKYGFVPFG